MGGTLSNANVTGAAFGLIGKDTSVTFASKNVTNTTDNVVALAAGETFYLCAAGLSYTATANLKEGSIYVGAAGAKILHAISSITATYKTSDSGTFTISYPIPIPIKGATNIVVASNDAAIVIVGWVMGWYEI